MKVACYFRVSSDEQKERGTIQNQVEFSTKYCDLHQLDIYKFYKEDGVSGTIPLHERPEGKQLIEDAKNKLFDTLLVYKLDRLGRSARVTLNSIYELEGYGIQIKSMTEPFDTSNPSGRFMITMLAGVADLERETILERMWHGANRAARDGKWLGGIVPYGYAVNDDGYLEINDNPLLGINMSEPDVIRLIYDLLVNQGYSTIKIADYLNALGVPPSYSKDNRKIKKGKRAENTAGIWRPERIRNMIVNETYKGIHIYGKRSIKQRELITRQVPAIVSPEVWDAAQQKLKDNQIKALKNSKRQYLLRGLVKCGQCGSTYIGSVYSSGHKKENEKRPTKAYYVCGGKQAYKGPLQGKCKSKNVPAELLEQNVWEDIVKFINNPGEALEQIDTNIEDKKEEKFKFIQEKDMLSKLLDDKQNERQPILDLFRKKIISASDVEDQLSKINIETESIQVRIKELDSNINDNSSYEDKYNSATELLNSLKERIKGKLTFEDKREIVKMLVKEIIITTVTNELGRLCADISIKYNFNATVVIHTGKDSLKLPT